MQIMPVYERSPVLLRLEAGPTSRGVSFCSILLDQVIICSSFSRRRSRAGTAIPALIFLCLIAASTDSAPFDNARAVNSLLQGQWL